MLIQHSNPKGRNIHIQRLQSKVHSSLMTKWDVSDDYHCHEAAHRNKTPDGYIAEVFTGDATAGNIDYKEVYYNDNLKAISFFTVGDRAEVNEVGQTSLPVSLIFFCNVAQLKPTLTHRADEEVRQDVITIFGKSLFGFTYQGYETGIDNVLREYPGSRRSEGLKACDMQPKHCFRINFILTYNANKNC